MVHIIKNIGVLGRYVEEPELWRGSLLFTAYLEMRRKYNVLYHILANPCHQFPNFRCSYSQ